MQTFYHHATIAGRAYSWPIDLSAAERVAPWAARAPEALICDIEGMATHFPHWLLAGGVGGRPAHCPRCAVLCVPTAGAIRCCACSAEASVNGLVWTGQLPALARTEPVFARRMAALRAAGFAELAVGESCFVLAPLLVAYPGEWPNVEPSVRYAGRWLDALGLPRYSGAHHIIGDGQACLFAWGQWSAMPIHSVLQQRVVNHLASLLKIAAGTPPQQAFIGRIHHDDWQPEERPGNR